jgi:hypothetical protein
MKNLVFAIVAMAFCFNSAAAPDTTSAPAKPQAPKTVKAGKFTFSYSVNGKNLVASVSAKTDGWISVGFNPKNIMQDANFIMGTILNNKPLVSDEFGDGMYSHKPDTAIGGTGNIVAGDVRQDSSITTMTFTIPLDSGDPKDAKLVPGQKVKLIFASGASRDIRKKHKDDATITITL